MYVAPSTNWVIVFFLVLVFGHGDLLVLVLSDNYVGRPEKDFLYLCWTDGSTDLDVGVLAARSQGRATRVAVAPTNFFLLFGLMEGRIGTTWWCAARRQRRATRVTFAPTIFFFLVGLKEGRFWRTWQWAARRQRSTVPSSGRWRRWNNAQLYKIKYLINYALKIIIFTYF